MKKMIHFSAVNAMVGVALCSMLFSFSSMPGAHNFQVYLDDKLIVDQYASEKMIPPTLTVDPAANNHQLVVKYSECGRTVTGRTLTIKDEKNKVLKDWRFEGASAGFKESMGCSIKDIAALKQKGVHKVKLYYSSNEFPEGQQVAYLLIGGSETTALK